MQAMQFLIFEICRECNLGEKHHLCPSTDVRRYANLPQSGTLSDDKIVEIVKAMYREHGFRGLVGWHYYNEPLLAWKRLQLLMPRIRREVPESRFVLWTNGTIAPTAPDFLTLFEKAYVTDYTEQGTPPKHLGLIQRSVKTVEVIRAKFDQRKDAKRRHGNARCLRPFTEFIIDYYGNVHLCCYEWQGVSSPGNVLIKPLDELVGTWQAWRKAIAHPKGMQAEAPVACRECWMRAQELTPLDAGPVAAAKKVLQRMAVQDSTPEGASVPKWGALSPRYFPVTIQHTKRKEAENFSLLACVGTWFEADIVEATVKNCFEQGCDAVYLVDNDSTDDTCQVAERAGAIVADVFHTDMYLEAVRLNHMNRVMEQITRERIGRESLWWLCCDADEFIQGPKGASLRSYLAGLPTGYNMVGAYAFDHYPTKIPSYVPGRHPADCQPYGMVRDRCGKLVGYWKHPLLLYPKGSGYGCCQTRGMHCPWKLHGWPAMIAPEEALLIHHVPFHDKDATFRRVKALCGVPTAAQGYRSAQDDKDLGAQGASRRYKHLEAVYAQRWDEIEIPHDQAIKDLGYKIVHWTDVFSAVDYQPRRWYPYEDPGDCR
jgi:hypothetical protein